MKSDQSMDRPIAFSGGREATDSGSKLEILSPAPSCTSMKSDQSMDRPIAFSGGREATDSGSKLEILSPAPSCTSMKSDQSMDRPIAFSGGREATDSGSKLEILSPAPSCTSMKSDQSMDRPIAFSGGREATDSGSKLEILSPAPSCTSMKSDQSMDRPIAFSGGREATDSGVKLESVSPAPSCMSMRTDQSVDRPIAFSDGRDSIDSSVLLASLLNEDHLRCSMCTEVLKDPVSIPCGHSYCKCCIQTYWTKPTLENSYCCPQCRKRFRTRPALNPSSALAKVVQKLQQAGFSPALPAHCYAGPGDVACDFCTGRKLRAVKSCLTCPASYCETHVRQHYTVAALQRHTLVEVTGELEQRLCKLHHRALEVFCKTDQTFICLICTMEEHKEHHTVLAKSEESPVQPNTSITDLQMFKCNSLNESKMEEQMKELLKDIKHLTHKVERAESELAHLVKRFCRGLEEAKDFTSDFVEVAALGRPLDLGMLYDCRDDSFSSDVFLWGVDTLSSSRLSLPQPHTNLRILEGKSLQDRLRALDLTTALRASVVSGLVEVAGAAAFLKHPPQSQLQNRVTLHYRTSTKLDMLSHRLLQNGAPLSVTSHNSATHVVVAVLYGDQMFFVFDNTSENSEANITLKDVIKRNLIAQNTDELLLSLEQANTSFECALYCDAEDFIRFLNVETAVKLFRSLAMQSGPEGERAVPLKVWLYPLKNLKQTSAHVIGNISEEIMGSAVDVLEYLERNINICQDMMSIYCNLGVNSWYPGLKEDLSKFSDLLQKYRSDFQRRLASCLKTVREKGKEGEQSLQDLLKRNNQSPFSPQNMHHWLLNKDAKVEALKVCSAADVTIVKSQKDMKDIIKISQADTVLCFTILDTEDLFLLALQQHIDLLNTVSTVETQPPFKLPDISQKILSDLHLFLLTKKKNEDLEQTEFIAAFLPEQNFPESSVCLYQFGNIVSCNVKLKQKPNVPAPILIKQTSVILRLQRPEFKSVERYKVEYRAVSCRGKTCPHMKWSVVDIPSTEESCVILKLMPETWYQVRYAVMDSNSMSDYSRITEFQTPPRSRPGQPTVHKQTKETFTVSWPRAEADGDSPVLHYMVEYKEAGMEGWQSILTEGPECECSITVPFSTCYRVRVSAVYEEEDTSKPSEKTEVPLDTWYIDLRKRKASHFLEVLNLQTVKKPVELTGWSDEESEVRSFFQCLPYISQLRVAFWCDIQLFLHLLIKAAECERQTGEKTLELLTSVCTYSSFPYGDTHRSKQSDFLLDLFSHVKNCETQTGRTVLPALQPVYQSAPTVWTIDLSKRKSSLFLEVLKFQTVKKPVELTGWSDEESEVRSFLQCLPYISQLRFISPQSESTEWRKRVNSFLLDLSLQAALHQKDNIQTTVGELMPYAYGGKEEFLLDLYSHVKNCETQTGRTVLPALQPVYQSATAVWTIDLSERKSSLFLEVLKLQTVKKPVKLKGWSDEESEVRSFLQCLPYISQLRFCWSVSCTPKIKKSAFQFLLNLSTAESDAATIESFIELLTSVCSYTTFPFDGNFKEFNTADQCDFLLDLFSHMKSYETQTGRTVLPALQPVYMSAPTVWTIDLSERKSSLFLEVLKLQTEKKPVELTGWSDEESEVSGFLQCLPYISQLRFCWSVSCTPKIKKSAFQFLLNLSTAESDAATIESFIELLTSVCSYTTFPFDGNFKEFNTADQCDFLLDLFSHMKSYETQTGRTVLPALQPVYMSAPAVWTINLSERKSSLFLEVLKLQTEKKPVELTGWSDEESEVSGFLQCLPYISQLRFCWSVSCAPKIKKSAFQFLLNLSTAESDAATIESFIELLTSVCSYTTFPFDGNFKEFNTADQCDFLLDLFSHMKSYETQTGRTVLPALQPVYVSAPTVWTINLSKRKSSLFLEVLKLQTEKKPVELTGWSDEESEVSGFLQCLPYISQLRISFCSDVSKDIQMFLDLLIEAAECEKQTGEKTLELLTSVCTYSSFPYGETLGTNQSEFLLDLFSHVKNYETQTGRTVLPALQPVYQSAPAVWNINLSERKSSLFLEVLKLQTENKPVELRGWSDEESEVRSFLQCLPYISQLRFFMLPKQRSPFLPYLCLQAAVYQKETIVTTVKKLMSYAQEKEDFLLNLFSHAKDYEALTGRSVLPALQPVYWSSPAVWYIDLRKKKADFFLKVLKLQTTKRPVVLRGWSDEESEVKSFLQCLPYISQLRFCWSVSHEEQIRKSAFQFLLNLSVAAAAESDSATGQRFTELLTSVCSYSTFPFHKNDMACHPEYQWIFLLDLHSYVKNYETQTGRTVLPALQPVYLSAPAVWIINLSERKSSLFLEVLKLQTVKKPVKLTGWSDEESEVRSFLQCLPYISQLRLSWYVGEEQNKTAFQFLLNLIAAAAESDSATGQRFTELLTSVCSYSTFPFHKDYMDYQPEYQWIFLLDLHSYVKNYETQTGRNVLPALQPVYQSAPAEWIINLSERKSSLFLEVLKLQTVKKPVELTGWSDEESEVRSFLQCLPYISQLRFCEKSEDKNAVLEFLLRLSAKVSECDTDTTQSFTELLTSMCSERVFPFDENDDDDYEDYYVSGALCDFLLDLFSHVKNCETQTGRTVLPALQPVYQSAPAVWIINLSERKSSLFLEVLKLQTEKKPVKLTGWSDEESEVRSFLQCLPYISQLRFQCFVPPEKKKQSAFQFLLNLSAAAAAEGDSATGQRFTELLTSVCSYSTFPYDEHDDEYNTDSQCEFLLDLCSYVKNYETQTGRTVLPALQPVYHSAPAEWIINLSERKSSLFLEVLKLQTEKKPVELRGWSDEESEVRSFLQCLPYISQLRLYFGSDTKKNIQMFLDLFSKAAESERQTGEKTLELLTSVSTYSSFPYGDTHRSKQSDFLLGLYSHVKHYETQTGRTVLPALQPVYQSVPTVWTIDLSERKSSLFLEVLKLQTVKKPVKLTGWSDEESEVRSFLQCLPYISQLRLYFGSDTKKNIQMFLDLFSKAAESSGQTGEKTLELLTSVCTYSSFPYRDTHRSEQCDFLLDLFLHVKNYEAQTGRTVLPALQPVYQSAPTVWTINLSERKSSLFLEVLKLQTVKKPVKLTGWSDEESEVRSFLQCLPYISQLRFFRWSNINKMIQSFMDMLMKAAECEIQTGEKTLQLLSSVCTYSSFPFGDVDRSDQSEFLLDLFSHVKNCETQTGRTVLPALQPVYQSAPAVWIIDLSERKSSLFLEVLKLQTEKKPVELTGWSDEESEVRSFLQCLPYISQLRGAEQCVPSVCKVLHSRGEAEQVAPLLRALDFTLSLEGKLFTSSCRALGRVLGLSASRLNLTLNPIAISLRGSRCLFRHITHLHTLRLSGVMVVKLVRALRARRAPVTVTVEELSLIQSNERSKKKLSRVLSSLASLLRHWNVQCLNMIEHTMEVQSLTVLLCHQGSLTIRLSKKSLQKLVVMVNEAQDEELTRGFLQKVGGDLTSCSLNWEMIHYFLQYHTVTVDFRKSNIEQQHIRELVSVLDRVQLRRLTSSFVLPIIREIYESGSAHCVSSLMSSVKNCINLNSRELDSVHCAALRFTLQHCTAVSLSLLWTSIPEGELESIVPLLSHVSHLSVDRLLLLRLLHCCSVSELQQGAAAVLLAALQHRLDFSCSSALDLTEHTQTHTLSSEDCRVISMTIQRARTPTQLILQDCEMEEAGVERLFTILHKVTLHCSKALLLQFLSLVHVGTELDCVRRAVALSQALGEEVDLSQTKLDLQACRSLALFLEHSEGLTELDLSHCQLTDHCLKLLLPHLHKTQILDLSHNHITDISAKGIYNIVSTNSNIQTVRLFSNRITERLRFLSDQRFEIW